MRSPINPIPEVGIPLVTYLRDYGGESHVIPPNGFQTLGDVDLTTAKVIDKIEFEDRTMITLRNRALVLVGLITSGIWLIARIFS